MAVGYAQVVLGDSPSSYWRLGDLVAGSSAADSAGSVTGTYSGQISRGMPGAVQGDQDSCAFFLNGKVDMGNSYAFTGTSAFSIEAWTQVQALPSSGGATIAGYHFNDSNGLEGWAIQVGNGDGSVKFFRYASGTADTVTTATNYVPLGGWLHVVGTFNGATMSLYINGALIGTVASTRNIAAGTSVTFQIAGDNNGGHLTAMVDEVAVYPVALTASQVSTHYSAATFLANAPVYTPATAGGVASAGQVNQSLGLHALTLHNTGTKIVGTTGATAIPGTTWTLAGQYLDQPFVLPSGYDTIDRVEVALMCVGTGADVVASIQADASGVPSGTALATVTIPAQFLPVNRARMVSLPLQARGLTQAGTYHLVLASAGTAGTTLAAPQGGSGMGNLQTSPTGSAPWTTQTGVQLIAGIYQGDAPPVRNVRESSTSWAEAENDASGHLVGAYEMVGSSRTAHRFQYSGYGRLTQIL